MITDFVLHRKTIFHRKCAVVVFMASLKLTTEWMNGQTSPSPTPYNPAELIKCGNSAFYCAYLFRFFDEEWDELWWSQIGFYMLRKSVNSEYILHKHQNIQISEHEPNRQKTKFDSNVLQTLSPSLFPSLSLCVYVCVYKLLDVSLGACSVGWTIYYNYASFCCCFFFVGWTAEVFTILQPPPHLKPLPWWTCDRKHKSSCGTLELATHAHTITNATTTLTIPARTSTLFFSLFSIYFSNGCWFVFARCRW